MNSHWSRIVVLGVLSLVAVPAAADDKSAGPPGLLDAEALAARIDELLAPPMAEKGVTPAPRSDDAEFIRRAYLDLAGCIPSIIDVRDFLDDTRPDKRRIWVDMLLDGKKPSRKPDAYNHHFANVWRAWLLSRVNNEQGPQLAPQLEVSLRQRFKENAPYDRIVRDLIVSASSDGAAAVFYQANENKPENLAGSVSRLFLGIKLECAQCHDDRSGGNWTQDQFWSFAAFFGGVDPQRRLVADTRKIRIPGKNKIASARFLDNSQPAWKDGVDSRVTLADWMTTAANPYFARAGVNRMWSYFFGVGLTDPIDEQGDHNPPSHPELLDELARQFAGHNFDLKYLYRAIVASRAYQRSSVGGSEGADDLRLFARMPVRGLSAEQLFDSLAEATEYQDNSPPGFNRFGGQPRSPRDEFLSRFSHQDKTTEAPTSILQALYLMNSSFVAERTSLEHNRTLATIADSARTSMARRVETLFLVVLSRKPTPAEAKRFIAYVERGGPSADSRKALADVFWALLNSAEFRLNH
jgi:hypothetical protein